MVRQKAGLVLQIYAQPFGLQGFLEASQRRCAAHSKTQQADPVWREHTAYGRWKQHHSGVTIEQKICTDYHIKATRLNPRGLLSAGDMIRAGSRQVGPVQVRG